MDEGKTQYARGRAIGVPGEQALEKFKTTCLESSSPRRPGVTGSTPPGPGARVLAFLPKADVMNTVMR